MNALSCPTWMVHVSSVLEWIMATWLVYTYGQVTKDDSWTVLAWGMLPSLVSAMCACTWHFFDNAESLEWLVTTQAATTVIGNCTLCFGAWWVWRSPRLDKSSD